MGRADLGDARDDVAEAACEEGRGVDGDEAPAKTARDGLDHGRLGGAGRAEEDARVRGGRQQRGVGRLPARVGGGERGERREHALVDDLLERRGRGVVVAGREVGVEQPVP